MRLPSQRTVYGVMRLIANGQRLKANNQQLLSRDVIRVWFVLFLLSDGIAVCCARCSSLGRQPMTVNMMGRHCAG